MNVKLGVVKEVLHHRAMPPIGPLVRLIDLDPKILSEQGRQPDIGLPQHSHRGHRVKHVGEVKAQITAQDHDVIFCRVEDFLNVRVGADLT